jgi:hypothetical protein
MPGKPVFSDEDETQWEATPLTNLPFPPVTSAFNEFFFLNCKIFTPNLSPLDVKWEGGSFANFICFSNIVKDRPA